MQVSKPMITSLYFIGITDLMAYQLVFVGALDFSSSIIAQILVNVGAINSTIVMVYGALYAFKTFSMKGYLHICILTCLQLFITAYFAAKTFNLYF